MMVYKKGPSSGGVALATGVLVVGGLGLMVWGFSRAGRRPLKPVPEGVLGNPTSASFAETVGPLQIVIGNALNVATPYATYRGSGRDAFTYCRIVQIQNGVEVTVMGSGVAGVHIGPPGGPADTDTNYYLVAPDQPEPAGCPRQNLCVYPWPGPPCNPASLCEPGAKSPTPICGAPPVPGPATVLLEIYERTGAPPDFDGFSSPTCNSRIAVARSEYHDKIMFVR